MTSTPSIKRARSGPLADQLFGWVAKGCALLTLGLLIAILTSLTISAWPAIHKYGFSFLTSTVWDPVQEEFGGFVMIYGTIATSIIALMIAVPVSFGIALFLTELSPAWLKRPLAIMIIPFIASVMRDVFEVTPPLLKESAYGLGATTWEVVSKVVLPYTKTGVIGGIMLGLGRAIGETMAVTFVIGNFNQLDSLSLFQAANSITSALANEFAEAGEGLHQAALMYLGLVLFFITFVILSLSKILLSQLRKGEGAKT